METVGYIENIETSKQIEFFKQSPGDSTRYMESSLQIKKKTTGFLLEEDEKKVIFEKKNTNNLEEEFQNSSERLIDKEFAIIPFDSKRNSKLVEDEEEDFFPQVPRRITYDGCKRKEGIFILFEFFALFVDFIFFIKLLDFPLNNI